MDEQLERQLTAQAVAGDRDALTALLEAHGPSLRIEFAGKIAARWRSALEIDDVLQATYLEAFLRINQFDDRGSGSFRAWLSKIAQNNLNDAVKALERAKRMPPEKRVVHADATESSVAMWELLVATSDTPNQHVATHEIHNAVRSAIRQLPADYFQVLSLYDLQCQSAEEVAKQMNRTVGAVYMLRSRALDRLRETLGSESRFFSGQ